MPAHLPSWCAGALVLAQSPEAVGDAVQRVLWSVAGIIVGIAMLVIIALVVRRLLLGATEAQTPRGFTLAQMRRLHEQGHLSDEEWAAARDALLAQARQGAANPGEAAQHREPGVNRDLSDAPPPSADPEAPKPDDTNPHDPRPPSPGGPGSGPAG